MAPKQWFTSGLATSSAGKVVCAAAAVAESAWSGVRPPSLTMNTYASGSGVQPPFLEQESGVQPPSSKRVMQTWTELMTSVDESQSSEGRWSRKRALQGVRGSD